MRAFGVEDFEILATALAKCRLDHRDELPAFGNSAEALGHFHRPRGEDEDVRLARDGFMTVDRPEAAQRDRDPLLDDRDLVETPHHRAWDLEREEVLHDRN